MIASGELHEGAWRCNPGVCPIAALERRLGEIPGSFRHTPAPNGAERAKSRFIQHFQELEIRV
jgi:hypothetical protein